MAAAAILFFWKIGNLNDMSPVGGQSASSCQIPSKSVKWLRRYGDLTVSKMAAVRHLGLWKIKFREDRSIHCCDIAIFVIFQDGCRRHLGFWKIGNFIDLSPIGFQSASPCQISSKSVKRVLRYGDLTVFSKWRRPPSWICRARIGTTHEVYLVVFIVVLNLVWIAAVLSIIWKF